MAAAESTGSLRRLSRVPIDSRTRSMARRHPMDGGQRPVDHRLRGTGRGTVRAVTTRCPDCGAVTNLRTCEQLFHELLALDHQHEQPWASFHAINVACYVLQHPSTTKASHLAAQRKLIATFCDDGLAGVHALTANARERNSHRAPATGVNPFDTTDDALPATAPPRAFTTTIHDVASDGSFPADGYADRVAAWAEAVRTAWTDRTRSR